MWERLTERLAEVGLKVDPAAAETLAAYLGETLRWNRVHNLTAITDPDAMIRRHVIESLALRPLLRGRRVADVGSGAGVPGIPLAIAEPDRHFTLIESRAKRAAFLRHVQGLLGLVNVAVEHCRVEEMNDAGTFDTLLARAVAPPEELPRLTVHLFGPDTVMLVPTGGQVAGERTSGGRTSGGRTSGERTSGERTSGGRTSGGRTSGGRTSGGRTSGERTSGERTSGERTSGERTSGERTSGERTSGERTSRGRTSGGRSGVDGRFHLQRAQGAVAELIGGSLLIISMKRG